MLNSPRKLLAHMLLIPLNLAFTIQAAEVDIRHGAAKTDYNVAVEGGFTAVSQFTDENRIEDEVSVSFDLLSTLPTESGELIIYVEGNKSPRLDGVSSVLGEANTDSGSALDRDGKGRLQVSELHFNTRAGSADLTIGLLDTTGFLDASDIANDETGQFISSSLVNNPSIEFPDYTIGLSYHRDIESRDMSYTILLASSHGLSDNPDISYSELVDLGASGKGVFAAAELIIPFKLASLTAGIWLNTQDHQNLDSSGDGKESNSGIYFVVDGELESLKWNLRYGMADDAVSEVDDFIGLAVELPVADSVVGMGYALTGLSKDAAAVGRDDIKQFEIYYNYDLNDQFTLTPSFQSLKNSGFDSSSSVFDSSINIFSLRANYVF